MAIETVGLLEGLRKDSSGLHCVAQLCNVTLQADLCVSTCMQTLLPMNPPHDSSPAQFNEALRGLLSGQAQVANASEQQQQQQQTQQQRQQGLDRPSPGLSLASLRAQPHHAGTGHIPDERLAPQQPVDAPPVQLTVQQLRGSEHPSSAHSAQPPHLAQDHLTQQSHRSLYLPSQNLATASRHNDASAAYANMAKLLQQRYFAQPPVHPHAPQPPGQIDTADLFQSLHGTTLRDARRSGPHSYPGTAGPQATEAHSAAEALSRMLASEPGAMKRSESGCLDGAAELARSFSRPPPVPRQLAGIKQCAHLSARCELACRSAGGHCGAHGSRLVGRLSCQRTR